MANPNQNSRNNRNGRYERSITTAERDAHAAQLRAEGWTFQQIADEIGFPDKSQAHKAVRRALNDVIKGPAEKLLAQEAARLDTLYEEALAVLERDHVKVSHGHVVKDEYDTPLLDDGPKLAAIDRLVKIRESYRRLFGLDQPVKVDARVTEVTQQDLELQEMLREAKTRMEVEEQQILDGGTDG
jgi:hypothetical protein